MMRNDTSVAIMMREKTGTLSSVVTTLRVSVRPVCLGF
jgi:hypothetical protein